MDMYKTTKQDKENALERFQVELLNDNRTIYGQIVRVSASGMTRWLRFFAAEIDHNGLPGVRDWTFPFCAILEKSLDRHQHAFKITGYGFCAVNEVATSLAWRIAFSEDKAMTNEQESAFVRRFKVF